MPTPREVENATWEAVQTDAGWHARLKGRNGEPVMTSQVYPDKATAIDAIRIAGRAVGPPRVVDERG